MQVGVHSALAASLLVFLLLAPVTAEETFYLVRGSTWKYFRGLQEASSPDTSAWRERGFDDSSWPGGEAPFGYGDEGPFGTELTDMHDNYSTLFLRSTFQLSDPSSVIGFEANVDYDDGVILWINGVELDRPNVPGGEPAYDDLASGHHESGTYEGLSLPNPETFLVAGMNVVAVQVFNVTLDSSDLKLDLELLDPFGPDLTPPVIKALIPPAGVTVRSLTQIEVTFSEEVSEVDAADLRVNGLAASSLTGSGQGPFVFVFEGPPEGLVDISWAADHSITDLAEPGNVFAHDGWTYNLDPTAPLAEPVLSEIMATNRSGLRDEDGDLESWIEICNRGVVSVDLTGWALTDDPEDPGKWVFPAVALAPQGYLVVFASGKDRKPIGGELHTNFQLDADREYLGLYRAELPRSAASEFTPSYPQQRADFSYGISATGELSYLDPPTPGSSNISAAALTGIVPTPKLSTPSGFYDDPFVLTIATAAPETEVRYTLNGSEPTQGTGLMYDGPISVDGTTPFRAAAFRPGYVPSVVETCTYIFLADVIRQPEMDQSVVDDPAYSGVIADALQSIPTLSIVMDHDDMFGASGAYYDSNERPASVEFIYPESGGAFQIDCGVEHHSNAAPKTSLRLKFKREHGPATLRFPFFESAPLHANSAVRQFDRIILRSGKGQSWTSGRFRDLVTYVEDQWVRDSQIAMSGIGSHGTFVHLYINGEYWGLYNPVERPDAWFTSAYFGGEMEDYFATNFNITEGHGQHLSGDSSRFDRMIQLALERDLEDPAKYEEFKELLDLEKYVDYVILFWFSGFGDGIENNWYAGNRNNPPGPFMFFMWDGEFIFLNTGGPPGHVSAWVPPYFFDSSLEETPIIRAWKALFENVDFRTLFADRIYRHCFNDGVLTDESSRGRLKILADSIEDAIVGESARWGEGRTRDEHWRSAVQVLDGKMAGNVEVFISALRGWFQTRPGIDLYPDVDPPELNQNGGNISPGFLLQMTNPNASGTIFYTLDGTDPRLAGGALSPESESYSGAVVLADGAHVMARVRRLDTWSPLNEAIFTVVSPRDALRITEIMYNPPGGASEEFIELQNTSSSTIDLSAVSFTDGIYFTFAPGTALGPGEFLILVADPETFSALYPEVPTSGRYSGSLSNGGERLSLRDADGAEIVTVDYDDEGFWPLSPDGFGYSLVLLTPDGPPRSPTSWRASAQPGGSPGAEDPLPFADGVVVSEILTRSSAPLEDAIELYNPTSYAIDIGGWFLSDSRSSGDSLQKFRIPEDTVIEAGGYLVFYEYQFNVDPGSPKSFALSSAGDDVYLASADQAGSFTGYLVGHEFDAADDGVSLGVYMTSVGPDFTALGERSFGFDHPETLAEFRQGAGAPNSQPLVGPVVINEIHFHPLSGMVEFVEIYNQSAGDVALYDEELGRGWRLRGPRNAEETEEYEFPAGALVPAGGFLIVVPIAPDDFRSLLGIAPEVVIHGPYGGALDNGGEWLELMKPRVAEGDDVPYIVVDRVRYDDEVPWPTAADGEGPSLERVRAHDYGNEPLNWQSARAVGGTPGALNSVSQPGVNQWPVASFTATPQSGGDPLMVAYLLDASPSDDPDGEIVSYEWEFGDGETGSGEKVTHLYATGYVYHVKLTVTDNDGDAGSAIRLISTAGTESGGGQFPGDSNQDGAVDISDPISLLGQLFLAGEVPPCEGNSVTEGGNRFLLDLNGDGSVDLSDVIYQLSYLFIEGSAPVLGGDCLRIEGCPDLCTP